MEIRKIPLTSNQSEACVTALGRVIEMAEGADIVDDSLSDIVAGGFKALYAFGADAALKYIAEEAGKLPDDFCLEEDKDGHAE